MTDENTACTAFIGTRRIASGPPRTVAAAVKQALDRDGAAPAAIFADATGKPVEIDMRGTVAEVLARLADRTLEAGPVARGPGRPKLGVVAREVTLLPRHWDWLNDQPGGASVALRKLVDMARKASGDTDRVRSAQEVAHRFISAMAGDEVGYEEALRGLYARDQAVFERMSEAWPTDIRDHARRLAAPAFPERTSMAADTPA